MSSLDDMPTVLTFREGLRYMSRSRLETMIRSGRGQRPCRGIYVTHNGPITPRERDLIALKACGPAAALAGLSALRYDGFRGFEPLKPTVVQPVGASAPPYDDLIGHWSIWLDERDVHPVREPRRTRPQRSLIDAASWAESDPQARVIIIAGVQQGLVNTRSLREALVRRGTCRRRALIIESVLDAHGGIQSLPERDFRQICADHRLPRASRQAPVKGKGGRYYLDVEWREYGVAVEIHGIPHLEFRHWDGDLDRGNEIAIQDKRLLIFSSYSIRHRQERVADQLVRMLTACGWRSGTGIAAVGTQ